MCICNLETSHFNIYEIFMIFKQMAFIKHIQKSSIIFKCFNLSLILPLYFCQFLDLDYIFQVTQRLFKYFFSVFFQSRSVQTFIPNLQMENLKHRKGNLPKH